MNKVTSIIPVSIFAILAGLFISGGVYATEASSNTQVNLELATVINITTPETSNINCASLNTLCTSTATVTVGTNNSTGYTLQLNATSGYPNSLTNAATSETIPTLSGAYAAGSFPTNYWGYTGGLDKSGETGGLNCAANYCPVLAYQSNESNYAPNHVIKTSSAPASESTTVTFGAKADVTKSSGTYSTSVTFTAVANHVPAPAMQDFDTTACANATTDQTFVLRDSRDDNEYTIAKLQDGNCWMTQNLALGGSTAMNLTQADSNVGPSGFTLPAASSSWSYSSNPEFYDYAGNNPSGQAINKYGNFYNWPAATASSGSNNSDAQYSICPKNWRLPSAGTASTTNNEFYTMLNYYITTGTWNGTYPYYWSGVTTSDLMGAPVSLVLSGNYYGDLDFEGVHGYWWSSTASGTKQAYHLHASSSYAYPREYSGHSYGYSVRCLISSS